MDDQILQRACSQIYQRFPDLSGVKPKVKSYDGNQNLLIFQGKAKTSDGKSLPLTIRVVVDASGNIGKISSSR